MAPGPIGRIGHAYAAQREVGERGSRRRCVALAAAPAGCGGRLAAAPRRRDVDVSVDGQRYNTTPTNENVTVKSQARARASRSPGRPRTRATRPTRRRASARSSFQETNSGLVNTDWSSNPPPPSASRSCARRSRSAATASRARSTTSSGARARRCSPSRCSHGTSWTPTGGGAERRHELERLPRHRADHGARVPGSRSSPRRSARRSRRPARSAIRTAAACARRGGCTASAR